MWLGVVRIGSARFGGGRVWVIWHHRYKTGCGPAGIGKPRSGSDWQSWVLLGRVWVIRHYRSKAWYGVARIGWAGYGVMRQGAVWVIRYHRYKVGQSVVRLGMEGIGSVRFGTVWYGEL